MTASVDSMRLHLLFHTSCSARPAWYHMSSMNEMNAVRPDGPVRQQAAALRPPLKWAGGKRWLVPHLASLWAGHTHRRLVEPFCGGLAVTLGLDPARALLNDINPHLISFYRWLQQGLQVTTSMHNDRELYYQ